MEQEEFLEGAGGGDMVTTQKKAPWTLKALWIIVEFRLEIFWAFLFLLLREVA